MASIIARLSDAGVRLYAFVLEQGGREVYLSFSIACQECGIRTDRAYRKARSELITRGIISEVKNGRSHIVRLLTVEERKPEEPVEEPVATPIVEPVEVDRNTVIARLKAVYVQNFPEKPPISERSVKEWLQIQPDAEQVAAMVEEAAARGDAVKSPPAYIKSALTRRKTEQPAQPAAPKGPYLKPGTEFRTEEEARQYWKEDEFAKAFYARHPNGVKRVKKPWQVTDEEVKGDDRTSENA